MWIRLLLVTEGEGECCSVFLDSLRFLEPEIEPVLVPTVVGPTTHFLISSFRLASVQVICKGTFCNIGKSGIMAVRICNC